MNPPKDLEITTSFATQFSRRSHKYFDIVWFGESWPVVQNYKQQVPHYKTIPEGFGLAEMYTSTRNPRNPRLPTYICRREILARQVETFFKRYDKVDVLTRRRTKREILY